MKKILIGFTSIMLALTLSVTSIFANVDTDTVKNSYDNIVSYYESLTALHEGDELNEIIAVESLGLEAEDLYTIPSLYDASDDYSAAQLAKIIIGVILVGEDPSDYQGVNLVDQLEAMINEDGSIDNAYANDVVWVLFALEGMDNDLSDKVASYLVTLQWSSGGFSYAAEGTVTSWGEVSEDPDTTGWCIEALSIQGGYDEQIKAAMKYLDTIYVLNSEMNLQSAEDPQYDDYAYWDNWGMNTDTQATILAGYLTYDKDGMDDGSYDIQGNNPLNALCDWQEEDGHYSAAYDEYLATADAARCLGTYYNDSFVYKVQVEYNAITEDEEDTVIDDDNDADEVQDVPGAVTVTNEPASDAPATADTSNTVLYGSLLLISAVGIEEIIRRKHA